MHTEILPFNTAAINREPGVKQIYNRHNKVRLTGDAMRIAKQKNKVLREFIRCVYSIFHDGFRSTDRKMSDRQIINLAFKSNQNILGGATPKFRINYPLVLFSKGLLPKPNEARVYLRCESTIAFEWNNEITGRTKPDDVLFLIEYNATRNTAAMCRNIDIRTNGEVYFERYMETINDELHYWMFFKSADGKLRSDSVYLGQQNAEFDPAPIVYKPVKGTYI